MSISGTTRVAAVIGDPVDHSLSPAIHNAAFEAAGLDWVYVALPVPAGRGTAAVRAMRDLGLTGLSVTMPHKADAAVACDTLSSRAAVLGSVNTVIVGDGGSLVGESTDGEGFLRSLTEEGVDPSGRRVLVVGTGGAARAVVLALNGAGARVGVTGRRAAAAREVTDLAGGEVVPFSEIDEAVAGADLVVNATPLGMGGEPPAFDPDVLRSGQVVVDLVYRMEGTPLLEAARSAGAVSVGGLGMLVHQAALAFTLWTGAEAPVEDMRAAAQRAFERR